MTDKNPYLSKQNLIIFLLIIIAGSIVRLWGIEYQSLWNDELSTWARSNHASLSDVVNHGVKPDIHPPGYQIIMFFIFRLFGYSELALRLPSAIAGIASILMMYLLGSRMFSKKTGLIAAALLSVFWCPVEYSQEARSYSMLLLFTLLSFYFWYILTKGFKLKSGHKTKIIVGYILSAIICAYLHYFGLLIIVLQGVGLLLCTGFKRKNILKYIIIYVPVILAYIAWIPAMTGQFARGPDYIEPPNYNDFIFFFEFLFNWSENITIAVLVFYIFLFLYTVRSVVIKKNYRNFSSLLNMPEIIVGLWLLLPFFITFVMSILSVPVFTLKNLIISLPAAYLLIAVAIAKIPVPGYVHFIFTVVISLFLVFHLVYECHYYDKPKKEQFREATKYIVDNESKYPDYKIICFAHNPDYFNFYFEKFNDPDRLTDKDVFGWEAKDTLALDSLININDFHYLWFIRGHIKADSSCISYLEKRLNVVEKRNFIGCRVTLFQNK